MKASLGILLALVFLCTGCTSDKPAEEPVNMDEILQIKTWLLDEELEGTGHWGYIDPLTREFPHSPDGDGYWIPDDGVTHVPNEKVFVYEALEVGKPRTMAPLCFHMNMGKNNTGGQLVSCSNLELYIDYEGIVEVSKLEPTDSSIRLVDRKTTYDHAFGSWTQFDSMKINAPCTVNVYPVGKVLTAEGLDNLVRSDTLVGKEYTIQIRATTLSGAPVLTAVVKLTTIPDPEYPWETKYEESSFGYNEIVQYGEERTRFCSIELVSYTYNEMYLLNEEPPESTEAQTETQEETKPPEPIMESTPKEPVLVLGDYKIVKSTGGYELWCGETLENEYFDFRSCQYVDKDGMLQTNYILVQKRNRGTYFLLSLTENGIQRSKELRDDYDSVEFYGDYLVVDNHTLYDGNFQAVGFLYGGQVTSATPLEEGGVVRFTKENGVACAYAHGKLIPEPTKDEILPWENSRTRYYGDSKILQTETGYVFYTPGYSYRVPEGFFDQVRAAVFTDTESAVVLQEAEGKLRACRLMIARGGLRSMYFLLQEMPLDNLGTFGDFALYGSEREENVVWLVGQDGAVYGFQGTMTPVCGDNLLLYAPPGIPHTEVWYVYDTQLREIVVLKGAAALADGTLVGQPRGTEQVVRYGLDGSVVSSQEYEKVWTVHRDGVAVLADGQMRFVDVQGNLLAALDGYGTHLRHDSMFSHSREYADQIRVGFYDSAEGDVKTVAFWYDPQTGEAGIDRE